MNFDFKFLGSVKNEDSKRNEYECANKGCNTKISIQWSKDEDQTDEHFSLEFHGSSEPGEWPEKARGRFCSLTCIIETLE